MGHIEFIGPPGAGKSALRQRLLRRDHFYDPESTHAIKRAVGNFLGGRSGRIYLFTPDFATKGIESRCLRYRFHRKATRDFATNYPECIQSISEGIAAVKHDPGGLANVMGRATGVFQLGVETTRKDEIACFDTSLTFRAISILQRDPGQHFDLEQYVKSLPEPETVIYVDAPSELCVKRQEARGRVSGTQPYMPADAVENSEKYRAYCDELAQLLEGRTSIIRVENSGRLSAAVDEVTDQL